MPASPRHRGAGPPSWPALPNEPTNRERVPIMSILVNKNTRLICQGITGRAGAFHSEQCKAYGTNLVRGVTPGPGRQAAVAVPVFDTCMEAVQTTGANATMIFVPPPGAADAILEAADAGIKVI